MSSSGFSKGIVLPNLNLDSDSSDDEDKGVEPLIFHPTLHSVKLDVVDDIKLSQDSDSGINVKLSTTEPISSFTKADSPKEQKELLISKEIEEFSSPILPAEIEIDYALIDCGESLHENLERVDPLTDSGSSGSSLMEKLEASAKLSSIITTHAADDSSMSRTPPLKKDVYPNQSLKTVHIDLSKTDTRHMERIHPSVVRRYGNTSSDDESSLNFERDEVESLLLERSRLKKESDKIIKHHQSEVATVKNTSEPMTSQSMIHSVDSMLENVGRILYEQADPGENVDIKHMLDNELEEFERRREPQNISDKDELSWSACPLDAEKSVKVNNVVMKHEKSNTENISTSIFTNSFLSASQITGSKEDKSVMVNTKPKRNILGKKKESKEQRNKITDENIELVDKLYVKKTEKLVDITDTLIQNVNQFKNEVMKDIENDSKKNKGGKKIQRQIPFDEKMVNSITANTDCLACFTNSKSKTEETPSKVQHTCENLKELSTKALGKETRSMGCSTDSLIEDLAMLDKSSDDKVKDKSTKSTHVHTTSNSLNENKNETLPGPVKDTSEVSVTTASKNSKNKKKKKNKANKTLSKNNNIIENPQNVIPVLNEKKQELVKELEKLSKQEKRKMLFDKNVSFDESYSSLPNTNKQLLLLKIPLESPGLCKASNADVVFSYLDNSASDNFIGLVTLFVTLLQGSKWEIQSALTDIPFDVVSLQQVYLDGEFVLIVGVAENQNTYQIKTKRTKLGTNFFHAVSHYLNTHTLDDALENIYQHSEPERLTVDGWSSNIWNQIENGIGKFRIPGSGKLSTLINILPDMHALQKILAMKPSLFVYNGEKKLNFEEVSYFNQPQQKQEYTCITISNILSVSPKHMCEFLLRLRKESVEVCGLKIGYEQTGDQKDQPVLAVGIYEVKASTVNEGRMLLSDCEELKEIAISFHSLSRITSAQNSLPVLNYVINETYSQREVVRWFGPRYTDDEIDELTGNLKSLSAKNVSNKANLKKKWSVDDNLSRLSLFVTYSTYAVLLLTTRVPSIFITFVVALASKNGLQLKTLNKNAVTSSQLSALGIPERQVNVFGYSQANAKKPSSTSGVMNSFCSMLFYGNSAAYRLYGLIEKLTYVLNNSLTGETLHSMVNEPAFTYPPSHNVDRIFQSSHKLNRSSTDYFVALNYNQATQELFKNLPTHNHGIVEDIYPMLCNMGLNTTIPELNLVALVLYGKDLIQNIPVLLTYLFGDVLYENLKSWRESTRSTFSSIQYIPNAEILGIKYLQSLSKHQASFVASGEVLSDEWEKSVNMITTHDAVLVVLRIKDRKSVNHIKDKLSKAMPLSSILNESSNIIFHSDIEYVCRLLFQFFHPNEIHPDNIRDRTQSAHSVLPEQHSLFIVIDKIFNLNLMESVAIKKALPKKNENLSSLLPFVSNVYHIHPLTLGYPLQLLLQNEQSFTGLTINYSTHLMVDIVRSISRVCRMGFQISGLKFPSIDSYATSVQLVLKREDAIFVLCKLRRELENEYDKLKFSITETPDEVYNFVRKEFKENESTGGIFHPNYAAILHEVSFVKDTTIDRRNQREIDWTNHKSSTADSFNFMKSSSLNGTILTASLTEEVNTIILPSPLLNGIYLNKSLPRECTFPEVWHRFENINYRTIAAKMTMLSLQDSIELTETLNIIGKKKSQVERMLSTKPFVILVVIGPCVLSDFWLNVNRQFVDDDAVIELKKHSIVAKKKEQVDIMIRTFFEKVLDNQKVEIKNLIV